MNKLHTICVIYVLMYTGTVEKLPLVATLAISCMHCFCMYMHTLAQLKPPATLFTNCGHTFILIPEPHLPSLLEVTFQQKRRREVEGAIEGVKRRKKDEDQQQNTRGKAVGAFMAAAEGVCNRNVTR